MWNSYIRTLLVNWKLAKWTMWWLSRCYISCRRISVIYWNGLSQLAYLDRNLDNNRSFVIKTRMDRNSLNAKRPLKKLRLFFSNDAFNRYKYNIPSLQIKTWIYVKIQFSILFHWIMKIRSLFHLRDHLYHSILSIEAL